MNHRDFIFGQNFYFFDDEDNKIVFYCNFEDYNFITEDMAQKSDKKFFSGCVERTYHDFCTSIYHVALALDDSSHVPEDARRGICFVLHTILKMQKCKLLWAKCFEDGVHIMFQLNPDLSLIKCIDSLKQWSAHWIAKDLIQFEGLNLLTDKDIKWRTGFHFRPIHPVDKITSMSNIKRLLEYADLVENMTFYDREFTCCDTGYHHIRFGTLRGVKSLNTKFGDLLVERLKIVATEIGCNVYEAFICRDHVHILAYITPDTSLSSFVNHLKIRTFEWMQNNIHFRRVEGWSARFYANSVSSEHFQTVRKEICTQDIIHRYDQFSSEMIKSAYIMGWPIPDIRD